MGLQQRIMKVRVRRGATLGYGAPMRFRVASLVAALLFVFSLALQINDPDPLPWIAVYGAAALAAVAAARAPGRLPWPLPAAIGAAALVWGLRLATRSLGVEPPGRMFEAWEMKNVAVEESRESIGLFLVAAWMLVLVAASLRSRARARAERG